MMRYSFVCCVAILSVASLSRPQAAAGAAERVRGTVAAIDTAAIVVATANGSVRVQLTPDTGFATVVQSDRGHITDGSFLGIVSVSGGNGSPHATGVFILPEAMRASAQGQFDWDQPATAAGKMTNGTASGSKMTNGTAATSKMTNGAVSKKPAGSVTLEFNDGQQNRSQTIALPAGIPVVALSPGQVGDVQLGSHTVVVAHRDAGGTLVADRVVAGKNGVVPPM